MHRRVRWSGPRGQSSQRKDKLNWSWTWETLQVSFVFCQITSRFQSDSSHLRAMSWRYAETPEKEALKLFEMTVFVGTILARKSRRELQVNKFRIFSFHFRSIAPCGWPIEIYWFGNDEVMKDPSREMMRKAPLRFKNRGPRMLKDARRPTFYPFSWVGGENAAMNVQSCEEF